MSPAERVVLEFLVTGGYSMIATGGGCTAFERKHAELGVYVLITAKGDPEAPRSMTDPVTVGLYSAATGDCLGQFDADEGAVGVERRIKLGEWRAFA